MESKRTKEKFFNGTTLKAVGVGLILFLAIALLWHGNATSSQAAPALVAQVYFDGEYRIADGQWQKITEGEHISSTKGNVTLRGNFHMLAPDGEYVGIYTGDMPLAFYTDHINLTIYEGENEPYVMDMENPLFGASSCGVGWNAYSFTRESQEPIEILIHNPHKFGNETAIDELLSRMAFWSGLDFEKSVLESGDSQRGIGLMFIIAALLFLGTALFSTLIHIKNSKLLWSLGIVILFAGTYLSYSADGISFWRESIVSNTTMLVCSVIFYMLFLSMTLVHLLKVTKRIGAITVTGLGIIDALFLILPIATDVLFYDLLLYWAVSQTLANTLLLVCLIREFAVTKESSRFLYLFAVLPLISFEVDVAMIGFGIWNAGISSKYVFFVFFVDIL